MAIADGCKALNLKLLDDCFFHGAHTIYYQHVFSSL